MRSVRAFDSVLGSALLRARFGSPAVRELLVLDFEGAPSLHLFGAADGVSLACGPAVHSHAPTGPCPPPFAACLGRRLVAAAPSVGEYDSVHDDLDASGVVLEFEGGRRVHVENDAGELCVDRTGRLGRTGGHEPNPRRVG